MRYLIVWKQTEDGCDYTIGCGISTRFVEASSPEEAFDKMSKGVDWDSDAWSWKQCSPGSEGALSSIWVVPAPELNEHLWPAFISKMDKHWADKDEADDRAKKLVEFEKLRKELGK